MDRRTFLAITGGLGLGGWMPAAEPAKRAILELRYLRMRTNGDNQLQRTSDFLQHEALPALQRAGIGPVGFFGSVIAADSPFILAIAQFPSLAAMEAAREKEAADEKYRKSLEAYVAAPALGYERIESSLLRCFESIPAIEMPATEGRKTPHVFELRMYESNNTLSLARKRKMFNEGEIAIFRRVGMNPVFFGETIVGAKMPNLVYMLAFDSLAHREQAWNAFGSDPEWKELRSKPGNSDSEIVSNISNTILRPLAFSPIR